MKPVYKKEIACNLSISIATLQRRLKKANLTIPRGLIFPQEQEQIYITLGRKDVWDKITRQQQGLDLKKAVV